MLGSGSHSGEVRHRHKPDNTASNLQNYQRPHELSERSPIKPQTETSQNCGDVREFLSWVNLLIGVSVMILLAVKYSQHFAALHDAAMWFSNIQEVEREISFRSESGLYYSYYKQLVHAPSILQGLNELIHDENTEHPSTINVLQRMNIYQEVIMAVLYRLCIPTSYPPVYFYINTVFALQGVKLSALYIMTWMLSGTWMAGVLMSAFLLANRHDETRVDMMIPLRENWSLPFFWIQVLLLTYYIQPTRSSRKQAWCIGGMLLATTLFALTWQFNQFVLLLQAMALFATQLLGLIPHQKIVTVYLVQLVSLLLVFLLQFGNTMILTGLVFSFIPAALLIMYVQNNHLPVCRNGMMSSGGKVIGYILSVFLLMKLCNIILKILLSEGADEHIYKFVLSKFGFRDVRDFDVSLYLCNGAFNMMELGTFIRMTNKLVFPLYILVHSVLLAIISSDVLITWGDRQLGESSILEPISFPDRPQVSYITIQSVFYGILALSTMRMKYLWTPFIFVMASVGICDEIAWKRLLQCCRIHSKVVISVVRHLILVSVLCTLIYIALPEVLADLDDLREFYDPDTVDLMEWIKNGTLPAASFAGSMQLLAGVKLCTGRHITNHPHYEDKALRLKTKELYQMYGHREPEEVHEILTSYQTDFIILEDSICLSPRVGCRLPDIIDLDNGVIPEDATILDEDLVMTDVPLFCNEIRHAKPRYAKYFRLVFINGTFRVYKVL